MTISTVAIIFIICIMEMSIRPYVGMASGAKRIFLGLAICEISSN